MIGNVFIPYFYPLNQTRGRIKLTLDIRDVLITSPLTLNQTHPKSLFGVDLSSEKVVVT
jgi:hypothetical protein